MIKQIWSKPNAWLVENPSFTNPLHYTSFFIVNLVPLFSQRYLSLNFAGHQDWLNSSALDYVLFSFTSETEMQYLHQYRRSRGISRIYLNFESCLFSLFIFALYLILFHPPRFQLFLRLGLLKAQRTYFSLF